MTWLWWRQFRAQALVGLIAALGFLAYLINLGLDIRGARDAYLSRCGDDVRECAAQGAQFAAGYDNTLLLVASAAYLIPVVLAMFWGAPMVASELEQGTHKLVWMQSVTRSRWLITKSLLTMLCAAALAAVVSLTLVWAAAPVDTLAGNRFDAFPFGVRHLVPIAFGVLATMVGIVSGVLSKRRMSAVAIAGAIVLALLFVMPNVVRPALLPAKSETRAMTVEAINQARSLGTITGEPRVGGLRVPGAWVVSSSTLRTESGDQVPQEAFDRCLDDPDPSQVKGTFGDTAACLGKLDLHVDLTYQPNNHYWPLQLIESGLYLLLAGLLLLFSQSLLGRRQAT